MKKPELLAPAGSVQALMSAVQAGCDAVYLGADKFSARSGADNFDINSLDKWVDYCHQRGVAVHLAANTLIKESERNDFIKYIAKAYEMGVDAIIIQDLGMAQVVHRLMPDLPLHASTQMTVSDISGVRKLAELGYSRVVLARELTKTEIAKIKKESPIEVEIFVHGALCFSYSGQCLMSSIIGQRSGNRGMCAQPCRLNYKLQGKNTDSGYLMSYKDLCLAKQIGEICNMGIDSLKIEGRLKKSNYVATTVGVYRRLIDGKTATDDDINALLATFNRSGFTQGWYSGGADMFSGNTPSNIAENEIFDEFEKYTKPDANYRKTGINLYVSLKKDKPVEICGMLGDNAVTKVGKLNAEIALNKPLTAERVTEQVSKLGDSPFFAEYVEVNLDNGIILPISEINAVRREVVAELAESLLRKRNCIEYDDLITNKRTRIENLKFVAVCHTQEQAQIVADCGVDRIVAPKSVIDKINTDIEKVTLLPPIGKGIADTDAVMAQNLSQLFEHKNKKIYGGFRLNVANSNSADTISAKSVTVSPELHIKDIKNIASKTDIEVIAYGKLPLMVMRNCPAKKECKREGGYSLIDRRGEKFEIICGEGCISELINSKPIYMADKLEDIKNAGIGAIQFWFTGENADETEAVIKAYRNGTSIDKEFTRGHFYRGMM